MKVMLRRTLLAALLLPQCIGLAHAATEPATPIISTIGALLLVLVAIGFSAVLMKRYAPGASSRAGLMRVVGQMALGPHERVSIVEIDSQWLILGVTAHQVTMLTQMQARAEPERHVPSSEFGNLLARLRGKRDAS